MTTGDEPLTISWFFHGSHITPELGIVTAPIGHRGSMLLISSVAHKHRGSYTCSAKNEAAIVSSTVELKVNGTQLTLMMKITGRQGIIFNEYSFCLVINFLTMLPKVLFLLANILDPCKKSHDLEPGCSIKTDVLLVSIFVNIFQILSWLLQTEDKNNCLIVKFPV